MPRRSDEKITEGRLWFKDKKAEPLTPEEEELLWEKGLLGKSTPQALVDTILVINGIYLALRSGKEHTDSLDPINARSLSMRDQVLVPTLLFGEELHHPERSSASCTPSCCYACQNADLWICVNILSSATILSMPSTNKQY